MDYVNYFKNALNDNNQYLQDVFMSAGTNHGWPTEMLNKVKVHTDTGDIAIEYDPELDGPINMLEYGGVGVAPKPAIRNFVYDSEPLVSEIFAKYGVDALFKRGILP